MVIVPRLGRTVDEREGRMWGSTRGKHGTCRPDGLAEAWMGLPSRFYRRRDKSNLSCGRPSGRNMQEFLINESDRGRGGLLSQDSRFRPERRLAQIPELLSRRIALSMT